MPFNIRMGVPEMEAYWNDFTSRHAANQLDGNEQKFFKKLIKTLNYLAQNPRHNSLNSHEIAELTQKYGLKIFQSYLENNTPAAGRLFWAYDPGQQDITVLAIEPHPEDQKRGAYQRVKLSTLPKKTLPPKK
jgi:hypothetical protein